ncbi:TrmB family transcriptional regulator [Haloarcula halophila]|uniref:TrmB family transcriptional regulator n=1 Tax=Halomicroarcula sp. GCM10025335 TaxID=3252668 RepID=UPI00360CFEF1
MSELNQLLADFGLSDTEIDVYRVILEQGEATTGDVAGPADVTQSYVYTVAEGLADRNLITIDEASSPTCFRARPPEEVIDMLSDQVSLLKREMGSVYSSPSQSPDGFSVLESRKTTLSYIEEIIDAATDELLLVLPADIVPELESVIEAAGQRGVFSLLLIAETTERVPWAEIEGPAMTRVWDAAPPIYAIGDGTSGVMGEPGTMTGRHGDEKALAFADQTIADGFVGMALSNYWRMGETVTEKETQSLPADYTCFRAGIFDAARRVANGEELVGTVTVQDEAGDRRTFDELPITNIKQGLVTPTTNDFPNENSISFETDGGIITVGCPGGIGSFYEDYTGLSLSLKSSSE